MAYHRKRWQRVILVSAGIAAAGLVLGLSVTYIPLQKLGWSLLTVVLSYVGFLASVTMPQQYRAIASPEGKVLSVSEAEYYKWLNSFERVIKVTLPPLINLLFKPVKRRINFNVL